MSWARRILVQASESAWLRDHGPRLRFVQRASRRFLPGERLEDALAAARRLAGNGITSLITHLGENVRDRAEAAAVTREYVGILESIRAATLPAEISIKLTQLGLDNDRNFCFANLVTLIEAAAGSNAAANFVWIDMEQSAYVDATLDLHRRAREAHPNVGVCVQAYLRRTAADLESLVAMGASVRLVKGAYSEPRHVAFEKKSEVDENFFRLAQSLLSAEARRAGVRAVLGTHDTGLIARISAWAKSQGVEKDRLEFAMLYGIQRAEQLRLAREGYRSCVLVSYGSYWFPWYMRRLAERPANLWFIGRNLFAK
ncbi:MAG: proline dehydrogenase family protein [Acidobacteriota bacterium]|nr:proline dehydrogenase family protein [Acidobacteriota bacterium]MDE3169942.1 proline dehydrogenase family protein [Acidobacteriota bacterium]